MGGTILGQGMWNEIFVLKDGCLPAGTCKSIGEGRIWIDHWETPESGSGPLKHISGRYDIELNGRRLQGFFGVKIHNRKKPLRICM